MLLTPPESQAHMGPHSTFYVGTGDLNPDPYSLSHCLALTPDLKEAHAVSEVVETLDLRVCKRCLLRI